MDKHAVVEATRRWIVSMVIGLDLCPFARGVFESDRIRFVVSDAEDAERLVHDLTAELRFLAAEPPERVETTLLIHPLVLSDFLAYNDFLEIGDEVIAQLDLRGVIQLASFHPDYQFAGTRPGDVENFTNRSPFPMLHLLREESIAQAAAGTHDLAEIPRRNVRTLRQLGKQKVLEMLEQARGTA